GQGATGETVAGAERPDTGREHLVAPSELVERIRGECARHDLEAGCVESGRHRLVSRRRLALTMQTRKTSVAARRRREEAWSAWADPFARGCPPRRSALERIKIEAA